MSKQDKIRAKMLEQKRKKQQQQGGGSSGSTGGAGTFQVKYIYKGSSRTTRNTFGMTTTIREFISVLATGEIGELTPQQTKLIYDSQMWTYDHTETFEQIGYNQLLEFTVSHKVVGGAAIVDDEKTVNRERFPDWENTSIEPSLDKDDLMFIEDDDLRVKMPCGHVFGPDTIYGIVKMCAEDGEKLCVECPMCDSEWKFTVCIAAADLNASEVKKFNIVFTNRVLANKLETRTCNGCNAIIERPNDLLLRRCRCTTKGCTMGDFCWVCGKKWIGGGFIACGNKGCAMERINHILQTCEEKILIKQSANYTRKCPLFRACPRCATLVEYDSACKHMKCWGCKNKFCFYCLGLYENGKWPCGSYQDQCEPVARQLFK